MFARCYSDEPADPAAFLERFDLTYTRIAALYDGAVKGLPVWKTWLAAALPHIEGPRVLEISFGTGYLLTQYADRFQCVGLDYNRRMVETARRNLRDRNLDAPLLQGDVHGLPFADESFDCVVNTMAFTGYPDGIRAMGEIHRILRPGGRLVLLDVEYPDGARPLGVFMVNMWKLGGDLIRDMAPIFDRFGFDYTRREIGGFGSIHLYVATRPR